MIHDPVIAGMIGVFAGMAIMFSMFWPIRKLDIVVMRNLHNVVQEKDNLIAYLRSIVNVHVPVNGEEKVNKKPTSNDVDLLTKVLEE